jgi:hypothetical protein
VGKLWEAREQKQRLWLENICRKSVFKRLILVPAKLETKFKDAQPLLEDASWEELHEGDW